MAATQTHTTSYGSLEEFLETDPAKAELICDAPECLEVVTQFTEDDSTLIGVCGQHVPLPDLG